jgi:hypothetical protein
VNSTDAAEFFDIARHGLLLAEQLHEYGVRDNLLTLVRAWLAAEREARQLAGSPPRVSLLEGGAFRVNDSRAPAVRSTSASGSLFLLDCELFVDLAKAARLQ